MNIFILDTDPVIAAKMQFDKHVVKMVLETAQILAAVHHRYGDHSVRYKETHKNHPCTRWAGDSAQNYKWLWQHGMELCKEYTRRYKKTHACEQLFTGELVNPPEGLRYSGMTNFAQAMPDEYKHADPVRAYRQYYLGAKREIAEWRHCSPPSWWLVETANPTSEPELVDGGVKPAFLGSNGSEVKHMAAI